MTSFSPTNHENVFMLWFLGFTAGGLDKSRPYKQGGYDESNLYFKGLIHII
jgi:hypothetical protein